MQRPLHIGIIASSGGAAPITAYEIFNAVYPDQLRYTVVTDRHCGIESYCETHNIPHRRIENASREGLSLAIAQFYSSLDVDCLLMFFLRIITESLFTHLPTLNIHPAKLPDFKGMHAVQQAINSKADVLGATLHCVDAQMDGGPIVAQTWQAMPLENDAESLSFCQKVYLTLALYSSLQRGAVIFNPTPTGYDWEGCCSLEDSELEAAFKEKLTSLGYSGWFQNDAPQLSK
ncbi:MAG: hypothetical protein FJX23_06220 [Alphaproteobacteria bacterium]|nr:hypothetical protein [Alphaproteobacteria bacterium]